MRRAALRTRRSRCKPATDRLIREVNNINRQIQPLGHGRFEPSGVGGQG